GLFIIDLASVSDVEVSAMLGFGVVVEVLRFWAFAASSMLITGISGFAAEDPRTIAGS
ncbi:hypothetical protein U1Q18_027979, partial [Sarracenia purpurea var. burkii]